MRNLVVLSAVLVAAGVGFSARANALQVPGAWTTQADLVQPAQYYPPNTYRPYGYYPSVVAPPAAGVVTQAPIADDTYVPPPPPGAVPQAPTALPAPVAPGAVTQAPAVVSPAPAVVTQAPVVMVPVRPASCGEFRFWNGFACVDARFNTPYLGPRY